MMVVKKLMAAKFGGLVDKKLNLKQGLNVVFGPNESGKTSWADLFDVLMFGVPRKAVKNTVSFDRNVHSKYDIESGINIGASIEVDGNEYTFSKNNAGACKVKDSGLKSVPEWSSKTPGEVLFGVNHDTFVQTSFLKQMQPFVKKNPEIEMKIASMAQIVGANDGVAYSQAEQVLDELDKRLTSTGRRNSILPSLYKKNESLETMISDNRGKYAAILNLRSQIKALEETLDTAKQIEKAHEIEQAKQLLEEIKELEKEKDLLEERIEELKRDLEHEGKSIDEDVLNIFKTKLDQVKFVKHDVDTIKTDKENTSSEMDVLERQKSKYVFFEADDFYSNDEKIESLKRILDDETRIEDSRRQLLEKISEAEQKLKNISASVEAADGFNFENDSEYIKCKDDFDKHDISVKKCRVLGVVLLLLGLVFAGCIALKLLFVIPSILMFLGGAILMILAGKRFQGETPEQMGLRLRETYELKAELQRSKVNGEKEFVEKQLNDLKKQLSELPSLEEYAEYRSTFKKLVDLAGCVNYQDYITRRKGYDEFKLNYSAKSAEVKSKNDTFGVKDLAFRTKVDELKSVFKEFGIVFDAVNEVDEIVDKLRKQYTEFVRTKGSLDACVFKIRTRLNGKIIDEIEKIASMSLIDNSERGVDYTHEEIDQMNFKLQELQRQLGVLKGSLNTESEIDELIAENDECVNLIKHYESERDAVRLARELLKSANDDFEQFFAPKLNEATAEIFAKITSGKYQSVGIDREFKVKMSANDGLGTFDISTVSEGALEQVYFALRLALVENVYDENKMPPMFIDDAFVNFDEERLENALDILSELGENVQIVYFTCKQEIVDYAKKLNANIITHSEEWAML